jgi:hypothetical protein
LRSFAGWLRGHHFARGAEVPSMTADEIYTMYHSVWFDKLGNRRSAIWIGSDLRELISEASTRGGTAVDPASHTWASVRLEPDEARRWAAAAADYVAVEDAADAELALARHRASQWWRRVWPTRKHRGPAIRALARTQHRSSMDAAEARYAPIRDLADRTLMAAVERRAAQRAEEVRAQKALEKAHRRAVHRLNASKVWVLSRSGQVARVRRIDVAPAEPVSAHPTDQGPLTARELAAQLLSLPFTMEQIWDPSAIRAVEDVLGEGGFHFWWTEHEAAAMRKAARREARATRRQARQTSGSDARFRPGGTGVSGSGGFGDGSSGGFAGGISVHC